MKHLYIIFAICLLLVGCNVVSKRLFQAEVSPPIEKTPKQIETERRAADLIARFIEEPKVLKPVAVGLSASLGQPETPIPAPTVAELPKAASLAENELRLALVAMQKQLTELNENLAKYQGKKIEGTGFAIAGPSAIAIVIALVVLCAIFPPALTLLLFTVRRLKATAAIVVNKLEDASNEALKAVPATPEEAKAIEATKEAFINLKKDIGNKMDRKHKATVLDLKKVVTP